MIALIGMMDPQSGRDDLIRSFTHAPTLRKSAQNKTPAQYAGVLALMSAGIGTVFPRTPKQSSLSKTTTAPAKSSARLCAAMSLKGRLLCFGQWTLSMRQLKSLPLRLHARRVLLPLRDQA
jgi:hypothetical protein